MYCFLFYLGGISFGYVNGNWGFVFVCLLMGVGVSSVLPNFKALKLVPTEDVWYLVTGTSTVTQNSWMGWSDITD